MKKRLIPSFTLVLTVIYGVIIFFAYFFFPWLINRTIFLLRWDEAVYFFIHKSILATGFIPETLRYIGSIPNYIYPTLYMIMSALQIFPSPDSLDLKLASLALQTVLFFSLLVSSFMISRITGILFKNEITTFLSGILFLALPILSYRLFYLHATFYANFVAITFLLCFLYYLLLARTSGRKKYLILSAFFYGMTLFTHQLVFMMATILLGIDFFLQISPISIPAFVSQVREKTGFGIITVAINIGYLSRTPLYAKILSILGISQSAQFGEEMVVKESASALPPVIPEFFLILCVVSMLAILVSGRWKSARLFALFYLFLIGSVLLGTFGIHLPASFRYDTFYVIIVPILLSFFITHIIVSLSVRSVLLTFLFIVFASHTSHITNGFYLDELSSLQKGLGTLRCTNTVSYFRIAPWIPTLSDSTVYYAHVDIYNAHQDRMDESIRMFAPSEELSSRVALMRDKQVDCLVYEKNVLEIDGIRVKGWEPWRYENLYPLSTNQYEDANVVIFKFLWNNN